MRHEPELREDAKNLSIIVGSAALAGALTFALLAAQAAPQPTVVTYESITVEREARATDAPEVPEVPEEVVTVTWSADRLYGTVRTRSGEQLTGFIRWDRNEANAADLLDALKPRERGGSSVAGIRFGHVDRIEVLSRSSARFVLRSGEEVELHGRATDLGSGLRALNVDPGDGEVAELEWRDLREIDFGDPGEREPNERRLYGTLSTRSGLDFTGYVTWDVDEIFTTDVLDGDDASGERHRIAFADIESIERRGSWAARVRLLDGTELTLEGTNDVDDSNSGISVSDAELGQVKVDWDGFDRVRFHGPPSDVGAGAFDGGLPLHGTVVTRGGEELSGEIVWDADEAFTWEMLNGDLDDVEFNVEFGRIAGIVKAGDGVRVTLRDGRVYGLSGSNDVDDGNRGVLVRTDGRTREVDWNDFAELRLAH